MEGGCACGEVRFRLTREPIVVHACHCTWCQRETGTAFALNALIESAALELLDGAPIGIDTPSESGRGQRIMRCPRCQIAVWSHYAGAGQRAAFVRVGTLDDPTACPPHAHIFTASKRPWVVIPPEAESFATFYGTADLARIFDAERLARRRAIYPD